MTPLASSISDVTVYSVIYCADPRVVIYYCIMFIIQATAYNTSLIITNEKNLYYGTDNYNCKFFYNSSYNYNCKKFYSTPLIITTVKVLYHSAVNYNCKSFTALH